MESTIRIQTIMCNALDSLFVYTAQQNIGPTHSTRIYYMWFHAMSSSYNWINTKTIYTTKDNWNWDKHYAIRLRRDVSIWITCTLLAIMPIFVPTYDSTKLLSNERAYFKWSVEQQNAAHFRVKNLGQWKKWFASWNDWLALRQQDGSIFASLQPQTLPNGALFLDVYDATMDPETFPNPNQWTPLKFGAKKQLYLTYDWMNVRSANLSESQDESIVASADSYFPSLEARKEEIDEIVRITGTLTDAQKIQAEFWAGGPFTISPPGMFVWFWKTYMQLAYEPIDLDTFFASGLDLAIHLFETGRIIWGIKKLYMQSRPIQDIRRWYRGIIIVGYDGVSIDGASWVPYQESNFITPPFADFPSGHSAFSQAFALVMTQWFGANIKNTKAKQHIDVKLLCPMLENQTQPFGTFVVESGASDIQPGIVPSTHCTISWTSWQEMANNAGISRKYGGIHGTSAHISSQSIANDIHTYIIA